MFSKDNLGKFHTRTFRIDFIQDSGAGVVSTNTIAQRYPEVKESHILFTPSDPTQLKNAIASLIAYKYLLPDTFINVKISKSKLVFLYADLFKIHMPEYVNLGGTFMWDGRNDLGRAGLTRAKYEAYANDINNKIFDHKDTHHFLGFDTSFQDILATFNRLFTRIEGTEIKIDDLTVKREKQPNT